MFAIIRPLPAKYSLAYRSQPGGRLAQSAALRLIRVNHQYRGVHYCATPSQSGRGTFAKPLMSNRPALSDGPAGPLDFANAHVIVTPVIKRRLLEFDRVARR